MLGLFSKERRAARRAQKRDAALIGPDVAPVLARAQQGDVTGLHQLLLAIREGEWSDRAVFLATIAARTPRTALDAWCTREPNGALPFLVRGSQGIDWAWEARGLGAAKDVPAPAQASFVQRLRRAESDLHRAVQLDPQDPTAAALLVTVARGLGQPPEHARSLFDAAVRREPDNLAAHLAMLAYLSQEWHGSHAQMFALARETRARVPPWSDLASLVLVAHVEQWRWHAVVEGNAAAAQAYVTSPDVGAEVVDAWEGSLGSPAARTRRATAVMRNYAAFLLYLMKDRDRVLHELQRVGGAYTDVPWRYQGEPADAYEAAAAWAGVKLP